MRNNSMWFDERGRPIQAHGGWILPTDDGFFWYGEDKSCETRDRRVEAIGIRCYRSADLRSWHDCGLVLPTSPDHPCPLMRPSGVVERPRVVRCEATGRYVMWFHADDATYRAASIGVAMASDPAGPFELVRAMRPNNQQSRDMTLFSEEQGRIYVIYSSESNWTLHIAALTEDCLDVEGDFARVFIDQKREAPCVFAAHDQRYLVTSGCSGWHPNAALFGTAVAMDGRWRLIDNPCRGPREHTTFDGQITCIFRAGDGYLALIDHWCREDLGTSRYSLVAVRFTDDRHDPMEIVWSDEAASIS
ncbi:hypothetical protein Corgl_1673 [Coriobacterium glomerans PW2]|uniref:Glycoside hydrolase family 43 n=1 Tax=Coriobacterium glomerans (strain ATCC 49209 / DSM 20642 / JCM 10262 / PW2) TaxID=700015 RepID=F2NB20_CORGP|nr:glycoside hydrolase family 43 protein [Coriobacterium glomerans]AEB07771.1 hypothetical protein Corgl_1673 [Coriobacterium glomerans PW2]